MKRSGRETDSIYRRYDIISDDDLTESMNRVQEHLKKEAENRKVLPLQWLNVGPKNFTKHAQKGTFRGLG